MMNPYRQLLANLDRWRLPRLRTNKSGTKLGPIRPKYFLWGCLMLLTFTLVQIFPYFFQGAIAQDSAYPNNFPAREFRGAWVASVANIDWPSQRGLSVAQQKAELTRILDRMQELNLNAIVLQVRPNGDALYDSPIEPWSGWLTGKQGTAPVPYYDPLEFAIAESHKRNIELHAWINPYRAQLSPNDGSFAPNHMAIQYPEYAYKYAQWVWMDPGAPPVQDRTYNVVMDIVRRYDIDGLHIDDYFYPYPQGSLPFPDSKTYASYREYGGTLSLGDWRRQNVNGMIQRLADGIHAEKPYVKFGISPFGIYRPGKAPGIVGFDQYALLYADVKLWLERGWLDYLAPQLYWRIDPPGQSYPVLLDWWLRHNPQKRHIYAGNYLSQIQGAGWALSEFERQVALSRQRKSLLSLGNIFFSMKMFRDNVRGVNNVFKNSIYPTPALPPRMPWLDNTVPPEPTGVQVSDRAITWDRDTSGKVRSWALYQQQGNRWELLQVLNASTNSVRVAPGIYSLRAVDRLANESSEQLVSVQ